MIDGSEIASRPTEIVCLFCQQLATGCFAPPVAATLVKFYCNTDSGEGRLRCFTSVGLAVGCEVALHSSEPMSFDGPKTESTCSDAAWVGVPMVGPSLVGS